MATSDHPSSSSGDVAAPKRWTRDTPPTVRDIRNKVCWICREEEATEAPHQVWIHPCSCMLVAHVQCLTTWVRLQEPSSDGLKCPQCKTPFDIQTTETSTLKCLDHLHNMVSKCATHGMIFVLAGGVATLSTVYGYYSIRWFLGPDLSDLVLGGKDPSQWRFLAWLNLPVVPFALLLSGTRLFGIFASFAPFFVVPSFSPFSEPTLALWNGGDGSPEIFGYPPSPPIMLALLPVVRHIYRYGYTRLERYLLLKAKPSPRLRQAARQNANVPAPEGPADAVVRDEDIAAVFDRADGVHVNLPTFARIFVGTLMIPPLSALLGRVLLSLSSHSSTLRMLLGIKTAAQLAARARRFPPGLDFLGLGFEFGKGRMRSYSEFDPVWWRNTIGFSLFVVCRDAIDIWRRYMRYKEKLARRIADKPFTHVDYSELDLIT